MPPHKVSGAHTLFPLELLLEYSQLAAQAIDIIAFLICTAYGARLSVRFFVYDFGPVELYLLSVEPAVARRPFYECPYLAFYVLRRLVEVSVAVRL